MSTLSTLMRRSLADGRVTSTEAERLVRAARAGGVSSAERRFLSGAVKAQVDRFDTGAQSRLHAAGARWTAKGNDPAPMAEHAGGANRVSFGKLFVNGVSARDVKQGRAGDCYFLASAAAVAHVSPTVIKQALRPNADGTVSVRLFVDDGQGGAVARTVKVDRDLYTKDGRRQYAVSTDAREQWPALLEKAYAKLRGSYGAIGRGGAPADAVFALTGRRSSSRPTAGASDAELAAFFREALSNRRPAVAWTHETRTGTGIVPKHAYSVLAVVDRGAGPLVRLRNPWARVEPGAPAGGDGVFELTMAQFKKHFPWATA